MSAPLRLEDFQPHVGESFFVSTVGEPATLVLTEASALRTYEYPIQQTRPPFSLLFTGPASIPLDQAMWDLTNAAMGTLPIFIVPIQRDGERLVYQAIFN
jgi:hypothetical protein